MTPEEIFGDVIYAYTDADALADGHLIDLSPLAVEFEGRPINRMTCTLYGDFSKFFPGGGTGCDIGRLKHCVETKLKMAKGTGRIRELPPNLWIVENEVDGWTLMFPSDY